MGNNSNDSNTQAAKTEQSSSAKSSKELILELPASVTADSDGIAKITGKTSPNASIMIGMGIIGDSQTADSKGNFTLKFNISENSEKDTAKVTAELDGETINKEVEIKQNEGIIQKKAKDDADKISAEKAKDEKESANKKLNSIYRGMEWLQAYHGLIAKRYTVEAVFPEDSRKTLTKIYGNPINIVKDLDPNNQDDRLSVDAFTVQNISLEGNVVKVTVK